MIELPRGIRETPLGPIQFPEQGTNLGHVARALIFAPAVCNAAVVSLVRLGRLDTRMGNRDGHTVEILARLN